MKNIDQWLRSRFFPGWLLLFLFPLLCEGADISLEQDLQAGLEQSRPLVELAHTKLKAGDNCAGSIVEVTSPLGVPHGMAWKGMYIDAAARVVEPVPDKQLADDFRVRDFMQLSALQGSVLENRIFEEDLNTRAISTAKVLTLSNSGQNPVITLDRTNASAVLPTLSYEDDIKADIADGANQGDTIIHRLWTLKLRGG